MKRRKTVFYIVLIALILLAGMLVPYGIDAASTFISGSIERAFTKSGKETEEKSETEDTAGFKDAEHADNREDSVFMTVEGSGKSEGEDLSDEIEESEKSDASESSYSAGVTDESGTSDGSDFTDIFENSNESQQIQASFKELERFHEKNITKVTGDQSLIEAFVGDRNQAFVNAFLNYIYARCQDKYLVDEIHLLEVVASTDGILTVRMEASLTGEKDSAVASFLSSYDTNQDYYTIYETRTA